VVGAAKGRGFSFFGIKAWGMPPKGQVTGGWGCAAEERGFLCLKNKTWAWGMSPKGQVTGVGFGWWGCAAEERGFLCFKSKDRGMLPKVQVTGGWLWVVGVCCCGRWVFVCWE